MGYRDLTIRLELDDLGDGAFVEIRNPKLVTQAQLDEWRTAAGGEEGDNNVLLERFIVAWLLWDLDTGEELALPTGDGATAPRVPAAVPRWINAKVAEAVRPR